MRVLAPCLFSRRERCACARPDALGGTGIGSFESNLLSTITPLGHSTKARQRAGEAAAGRRRQRVRARRCGQWLASRWASPWCWWAASCSPRSACPPSPATSVGLPPVLRPFAERTGARRRAGGAGRRERAVRGGHPPRAGGQQRQHLRGLPRQPAPLPRVGAARVVALRRADGATRANESVRGRGNKSRRTRTSEAVRTSGGAGTA